mgnify:CR=1 FL=1
MAAKGVTGTDLGRVLGNTPTRAMINAWLQQPPGLVADDLVDTALKMALDAKANAEALAT